VKPGTASEATVNGDLLGQFEQSGTPISRIYEPNETCAVLGAGGNPQADLYLDRLADDGVPWRRRRGGGGTVVLTPGQVVLACVTAVDSPFRNREYAAAINSWFIEALEIEGVRGIVPRGISDLAIGEKKILGTSMYRTRRVLFYQASLLVSNDISIFTRYLAMPSHVPDYRGGRSHEDFCTTLVREGYPLSVESVMKSLKEVVDVRLPVLR
jgi:lipoate---protein ligase